MAVAALDYGDSSVAICRWRQWRVILVSVLLKGISIRVVGRGSAVLLLVSGRLGFGG